MKKQYSNTNEKNFKFLTILIPFISDLYICGYLWNVFGNKAQFDNSLKLAMDMIGKSGATMVELPQDSSCGLRFCRQFSGFNTQYF